MYMIRRISILLFTLCFLFNGALPALCKAEQVKNIAVRDRLLYQGNNHLKQTALTFDDGPDPRFTPHVLDQLKKYGIKATFFLIGAKAHEHPELVKRMVAEGHAVGIHTYWHPNLLKESTEKFHWEIAKTQAIIKNITGFETQLFRPPYGNLTQEMISELPNENVYAINWSSDSLDWKQIPEAEITKNVFKNMHAGTIVLMHDGGHWTMDLSNTPKSLDTIIPRLKQEGYHFVTVPELLHIPYPKN